MIDVLDKGILYLVYSNSPEVNTLLACILSNLLLYISVSGICLGVLITGFTLGSFSHDAKWSMFQGRPLVANTIVLAFFTFRIIDLAKLLVKKPNISSLDDRIILRWKSQDKRLWLTGF